MRLRFREKPVIPMFLVAMILLFVGIPASFQLANLPFIKGTTYKAEFAEVGGLSTFAVVRVADVAVGEVEKITLEGDRAEIEFTVKGVELGDETTAMISTDTLLGERGLTIVPKGDGKMRDGDTIPLSRTTAPYNVAKRIEDSTTTVQQLDKDQLQAAMTVFAETFEPLPDEFATTFDTVSRLSQTISSRDEELRNLLEAAKGISQVFKDRTDQFARLLVDGNQLFEALEQRRMEYSRMIVEIERAASSIGQVSRDVPNVSAAVNSLRGILDVLRRNEASISVALQRVAGFVGGIGEGVATGPWFEFTLNTPVPLVPLHEFLPQMVVPTGEAANGPVLPGLDGLPGIPGLDPAALLGGN